MNKQVQEKLFGPEVLLIHPGEDIVDKAHKFQRCRNVVDKIRKPFVSSYEQMHSEERLNRIAGRVGCIALTPYVITVVLPAMKVLNHSANKLVRVAEGEGCSADITSCETGFTTFYNLREVEAFAQAVVDWSANEQQITDTAIAKVDI